jgi:hypothetical protein
LTLKLLGCLSPASPAADADCVGADPADIAVKQRLGSRPVEVGPVLEELLAHGGPLAPPGDLVDPARQVHSLFYWSVGNSQLSALLGAIVFACFLPFFLAGIAVG